MRFSGMRWALVSVLAVGLTCCGGAGGAGGGGAGDGTPPESQTLSGVLYDSCSGDPVTDAQVRFGDAATQTDAGGAFEFLLAGATPTVSQRFSVLADGYAFLYVEELDVDTGTGAAVSLPLLRRDPASYSGRRAIDGRIYDGGMEITEGQVTVSVYGANGTSETFEPQAYAGGYAVETAVRSADSLVVVYVSDVSVAGEPRAAFSFLEAEVDLSAAASTTVDAARPPSGDYDFASLSNGEAGDVASGYYVTVYGAVPCRFVPATAGGELIPVADSTAEITFGTPGPLEVALYNPDGWDRLVLIRSRSDFSGASGRRYAAAGQESALGSNLALPDLDLTLGPDGYGYDGSLSLTDSTLSLSSSPTGVDLYVHYLEVDTGPLGLVIAREASVVLPVSVLGVMAGENVTDVFRILDIEPSTLRPRVLYPGGVLESPAFPPSLWLGEVVTEDGRFSEVISVPEGGTIDIGIE